jgi:hypothetical protein
VKCDIDHELISFASKDCPMCRLRDAALDVLNQLEQIFCELEELVQPAKKIKAKKSGKSVKIKKLGKSVKVKVKKSGKLLHFPRTAQAQPDDVA